MPDARLMTRFGKERVTAAGMLFIAASAVVALSGLELINFWGSLTLMGIGWNLSFIGATAMVTDCHMPGERAKAQGATAAVSCLAGGVPQAWGWAAINWLLFPPLATLLCRAARKV